MLSQWRSASDAQEKTILCFTGAGGLKVSLIRLHTT